MTADMAREVRVPWLPDFSGRRINDTLLGTQILVAKQPPISRASEVTTTTVVGQIVDPDTMTVTGYPAQTNLLLVIHSIYTFGESKTSR